MVPGKCAKPYQRTISLWQSVQFTGAVGQSSWTRSGGFLAGLPLVTSTDMDSQIDWAKVTAYTYPNLKIFGRCGGLEASFG